tara:strand:+ start:576 stop:1049 length:474 start_codon:yes stop_codon:yes gene_type:complete
MPISVDGDGTITGYTPNRPAFAAKIVNAAYVLPQQTFTKIPYETETLDTNSAYSTSNYRFTIPSNEAGTYLIGANVGIDDLDASNYITFEIRINNTAQIITNQFNNNSSVITSANLTNVFDLSVGDYVEAFVRNFTGSGNEAFSPSFCSFFGYKLNV